MGRLLHDLLFLRRQPPRWFLVILWWAYVLYTAAWIFISGYHCVSCGQASTIELLEQIIIYVFYFFLMVCLMYVILKLIDRLLYGDASQPPSPSNDG